METPQQNHNKMSKKAKIITIIILTLISGVLLQHFYILITSRPIITPQLNNEQPIISIKATKPSLLSSIALIPFTPFILFRNIWNDSVRRKGDIDCFLGNPKCSGCFEGTCLNAYAIPLTEKKFLAEMKNLELSKEYMLKRLLAEKDYWQKECNILQEEIEKNAKNEEEKLSYECTKCINKVDYEYCQTRFNYQNRALQILNEIPD